MAAKPTAQACHALTTHFVSKYKEVLERDPSINRNAARYGFEGMLMDFKSTEVKTLIDYYIEHYDNPSLVWFLYNYEKVEVAMQDSLEAESSAAKRRVETQKRLEEWRKRWNK